MKILYLDTETTGISPEKHAIVQMAGAIEVDGEVKAKFNIRCRPHEGAVIDPMALQVIGKTQEQLMAEQPPLEAYKELMILMRSYVNKFDRNDKYYVAGYNVKFDVDFLASFFRRLDDPYLGSFINWRTIDPLPVLHYLEFLGKIRLENYKLGTVCTHFGISLDAHDALNDIMATREVIKRVGIMIGGAA